MRACKYTNTCIHLHTRTFTHTHTHAQTQTPTHTNIYMHTTLKGKHAYKRTHTHKHKPKHTQTQTHTLPRTQTYTCTQHSKGSMYTEERTHTHTNADTHTQNVYISSTKETQKRQGFAISDAEYCLPPSPTPPDSGIRRGGVQWKVSRPCSGCRRRRQACKGRRAQVTNVACHMVKQERFTTDPVSHWPHGVAASECQAWAVRSDSGFRPYTLSGRRGHGD